MVFLSDTGGGINISNIRIIYDIEPPVMFGNTISNCDYGFFLNGTSPEISNNTIQGNDGDAVGIHYENTTAVIIHNKIMSNKWGIYIDPNKHSQDIREYSKREYKFEDPFSNTSKIDTINSGNLSLENGEIKLIHKTDWWNTNWRYRRNITITEALNISRKSEFHDFTIDFSSWSNKPKNANDVRIVNSSGSEVDREIITFDADDYVKFTIPINSLNASENDYIHMYYGNPSPLTPTSVDYNQTIIIWDENASISDLGGWPGSNNVENANITSIRSHDNSTSVIVTPARGNRMIRIKGKDNSSSSDSYWYAKFSAQNYSVPNGWYLGYFIYKNSTSPNGAGIDGNYSNGSGNLSDGTPKAYDQNDLPFHPNTNTTTYSNEQWYFRYTNDSEGSSINEWWIAYNDNSSSENGNFTYFFDYIYIGQNKGPLDITIPNEEVYYSTFGLLLSKEINLSANSVGEYLELDKIEYLNHTILVSVLNAENNQPITNLNYLSGTSIDISSIDYFSYPKIKLQAIFISNGSKTPKLKSWNITWLETIISYSIGHNKINNNTIGIYCDKASTLIANNEISSNSDKGIFYNKCESYDYVTKLLSDGESKTITFELSGSDSSAQLVIPKGVTITNASFDLTGYRYIPESDVVKSYEYQGYAINETINFALNGTINVSIPSNWEAEYSYVTKNNLTQNDVEINAINVNLSCEHNSTTKSFSNTNTVYFNSSVTSDSQNPLQFNLTVNQSNVEGNFSASVFTTKSIAKIWSTTSIGYTVTIPLISPDEDINSPVLLIVAPDSGYAEYNATIKETHQYVTSNITANGIYLRLDLSSINEIGNIWQPSDQNRNVTINLTYYTKSPSLNVGGDGDKEWIYSGEFNTTVTINEANNGLVKELNNLTSSIGFGDEYIRLVLCSASSGKIKITNISIKWMLKPQTLNNKISSNKFGIFIENSTNVTVAFNTMDENDYGVYISNTTQYSVTENRLGDGSEIKTITFSSGLDSSCKLRIPIGAVVTNASFNLTGSRYVPFNNKTTNYEYQGTISKSVTLGLNNSINITKPDSWSVNSATIQANWLSRPLGNAISAWSNNSINFSSSYWNRSSWNHNSNINMSNINWIQMAAKPKSEVIAALTLDNNNNIKAIIWNESTWDTLYNLTSVAASNTTACFDIAFETLSGNALAVWSNNSNELDYSIWNGTGWSIENSISISDVKWVKLAANPFTNNIIALTMNNSKIIKTLSWNGSAWNNSINTLTTNATTSSNACFDVTYNDFGIAMASWSDNSSKLNYSIWNGSSWSTEEPINETNINWIRMESYFQNIIIVTLNNSNSIKAFIYNGSGFDSGTNLTNYATTSTKLCFDIAYEAFTGNAIVTWSNNSNGFGYSIWNGTNWSSESPIVLNNIQWIQMDSDPNSIYIVALILDNNNDLKALIWNGSAWEDPTTLVSAVSSNNYSCFDIAFEKPIISVTPSSINLTVEHNSYTKIFNNTTNKAFYLNYILNPNQNILQFNLSCDEDNITGNFSISINCVKNVEKNWTKIETGYNISVPLNSPSTNITNPKLKTSLQDNDFAIANVTVIETGQEIVQDYIDTKTKSLSYITIDLTNITEINTTWDPTDTNITLDLNLTFYIDSPNLDVGADGDIEWYSNGQFNTTVKINEINNLVRELNENLPEYGSGYYNIPLKLTSTSAGNITISNITLTYDVRSILYNGTSSNGTYGFYIINSYSFISNNKVTNNNNTAIYCSEYSKASIVKNIITSNNKGIYTDFSSSLEILNNDLISNNTYGIYIDINSTSNIIENNLFSNENGIFNNENSSSTITNNKIQSNIYGINCFKSTTTINNNAITSNNTYGIYSKNSSIEIINNLITQNVKGIYSDNTSMNLSNNFMSDNTIAASLNNSNNANFIFSNIKLNDYGIYLTNSSNITIINCTFSSNENAIYSNASSPTLINTTISASTELDLNISLDSHPILLNSLYFINKTNIKDTSNITLKRTVPVRVVNETGVEIENAIVNITDVGENLVYSGTTDVDGNIPVQPLTAFIQDSVSIDYFTPHIFSAECEISGTFYKNPIQNSLDVGISNVMIGASPFSDFSEIQSLSNIYLGPDNDNDGLTDGEEIYLWGTDPNEEDTDGDSIVDGLECGITSSLVPSPSTFTQFDNDPSIITFPISNDTDRDGLRDNIEDANNNGAIDNGETNPINKDSDDDGLPDGWIDFNYNGIKDLGEYEDKNCDGILNSDETDPTLSDTDGGGTPDGVEVKLDSYDPRDAVDDGGSLDSDGDGLLDTLEGGITDLDELDPDSDNDGLTDGQEDADHDGFVDDGETDPTNDDSDNDGLMDGIEDPRDNKGKKLIWWYEAEDYTYNPPQQIKKGVDASGGKCIKSDPGPDSPYYGRVIMQLSSSDLPNIGGDFDIYVRAKTTEKDMGGIYIYTTKSGGLSGGIGFDLITYYRWYHGKFTIPDLSKDTIYLLDLTPSGDIRLDKIFIVKTDYSPMRWQIKSKQITDPNHPDTDGDGLFDGIEVKYDSNSDIANIFWYELEDYALNGKSSISDDSYASNGKCIISQGSQNPWNFNIENYIDGTYIIAERVKLYSPTTSGNIGIDFYYKDEYGNKIFRYSKPEISNRLLDFDGKYNWYFSQAFTSIDGDSFIIKGGTSYKGLYYDKLALIRIINKGGSYTNVYPDPKNNPYYHVTDPLDPDTDGDGLSDSKEMKVTFRTNAIDTDGDGYLEYKDGTFISYSEDGGVPKIYGFRIPMFSMSWPIIGKTPDGRKIFKQQGSETEIVIQGPPTSGSYYSYTTTDTDALTQGAMYYGLPQYPLQSFIDSESYRFWLNPMNRDMDKDELDDGEEFRVGFRTNVRNGYYSGKKLGKDKWIAIEEDKIINNQLNGYSPSWGNYASNYLSNPFKFRTPENYRIYDLKLLRDVSENDEDVHYEAFDYIGILEPKAIYHGSKSFLLWEKPKPKTWIGAKKMYRPLIIDVYRETLIYTSNPTKYDSDGDSLSDKEEFDLGTDPLNPDTDMDGLLDGWEVNGVNGCDLPDLGADPFVKDIFIEIDWMGPGDDCDGHEPDNTDANSNGYRDVFDLIINAFKAKNIAMHIDAGVPWSDLGGGGSIPHIDIVDSSNFYGAGSDDEYRNVNSNNHLYGKYFTDNRQGLFHYGVFGHLNHMGQGGSAYTTSFPSDLFWISLGTIDEEINLVAHSVLHELGHSFGLRADNYYADEYGHPIMDYTYPSVMRKGATMGDLGYHDYSALSREIDVFEYTGGIGGEYIKVDERYYTNDWEKIFTGSNLGAGIKLDRNF